MLNVTYGRIDSSVCCYGDTVSTYGVNVCSTASCSLYVTLRYSIMCDSKSSCTLNIPNDVDPCSMVYKYLNVDWDCVPQGK